MLMRIDQKAFTTKVKFTSSMQETNFLRHLGRQSVSLPVMNPNPGKS